MGLLSQQSPDIFTKVIEDHVQKRVAEIMEGEIKLVQDRVTQRVRDEVGVIAAAVLNRFTLERMGHDLVIRVDISDPKNKRHP